MIYFLVYKFNTNKMSVINELFMTYFLFLEYKILADSLKFMKEFLKINF